MLGGREIPSCLARSAARKEICFEGRDVRSCKHQPAAALTIPCITDLGGLDADRQGSADTLPQLELIALPVSSQANRHSQAVVPIDGESPRQRQVAWPQLRLRRHTTCQSFEDVLEGCLPDMTAAAELPVSLSMEPLKHFSSAGCAWCRGRKG